MRLFAEKGYGSTSVADILHPMLLAPAWQGVDDPIERVFALLDRYRLALTSTHNTYGCPIGSLALELHEPDPPIRKLLAANFDAWVGAIEECFKDAGERLPKRANRRARAVCGGEAQAEIVVIAA